MSVFDQIEKQTYEFKNLLKERDMAQAYHRITSEMGPDPQLVAFINYNNSIVTDDGAALESLNVFDQHNYLVTKLDVESMDQIAVESLSTKLKTIAASLALFGGFFVAWPIGIPLIVGGAIALKKIRNAEVRPVKEFTELTAEFTKTLRASSIFASSIPTNLDEKAWEDFHNNFAKNQDIKNVLGAIKNKVLGKVEESTGSTLKDKPIKETKIEFDKSGWTVESFKNATKWCVDNKKKIEEVNKKIQDRFETVEKLLDANKKPLGSTPKYISEVSAASSKVTHQSADILGKIDTLLKNVARNFEAK